MKKNLAAILISLTFFACNNNEFIGDWFITRIEEPSHEGYGIVRLNLSINDDQSFTFYGQKVISGTWTKKNDTLFMNSKDGKIKCYFEDSYLNFQFDKFTLLATKLPETVIKDKLDLQSHVFEINLHEHKTLMFEFIANDSVYIKSIEKDLKSVDVASWEIQEIGNLKFLNFNIKYNHNLLFYPYRLKNSSIHLLDFSLEHLPALKDYSEVEMKRVNINIDSILSIRNKLIGKWQLKKAKQLYGRKMYDIKEFDLNIGNEFLEYKISTSEDSLYHFKFKYRFGKTGDYFIFEKNNESPSFSIITDSNMDSIKTNYSVKFGEKRLRHSFEITLVRTE